MIYVGLTNDPDIKRQEHGSPEDWWQRAFDSKEEAQTWVNEMLTTMEAKFPEDHHGWRFGYTFTITSKTRV